MKKILCPIDFSEVSLNALEFAVAIGEKENSDITLLNIFTPADFNKILNTEHVKEEFEKLQEIARAK
jgi:nucleotide-binding universal stress UspA family protein